MLSESNKPPVEQPLWVFAYGSLIWRPGFEYEARVRGFVSGYARRFWQESVDHRGVPGKPGRVVTLVAAEAAQCWGVCYRVAASERQRVMDELDEREKGGYSLDCLAFQAKDRHHNGVIQAHTYLGRPDNPHFVPDADVNQIAAIVREATGPSGHNIEYVLRLAEALSELGVDDEHVFELANRVMDPAGVGDEAQ